VNPVLIISGKTRSRPSEPERGPKRPRRRSRFATGDLQKIVNCASNICIIAIFEIKLIFSGPGRGLIRN
jgi:hypothetical protein